MSPYRSGERLGRYWVDLPPPARLTPDGRHVLDIRAGSHVPNPCAGFVGSATDAQVIHFLGHRVQKNPR